MKRWILIVIAVLATVLALGAAAGAAGSDRDRWPGPMMGGPMMGGPMTGGPMTGSPMMPGMHADSERAWLTEMVAHHQEAVDAARELARSDRAKMRAFGAAIVADQSAQIELMEGWLEEWYGGPDPDVDYQPMMRDLSGLTGKKLDRVFLTDMVHHHMMAVMMSQQLLVRGLAEHDEVADLARDIRDVQRQEILRMRQWLARWFAGGAGLCPMGMLSGGMMQGMRRGGMMSGPMMR